MGFFLQYFPEGVEKGQVPEWSTEGLYKRQGQTLRKTGPATPRRAFDSIKKKKRWLKGNIKTSGKGVPTQLNVTKNRRDCIQIVSVR